MQLFLGLDVGTQGTKALVLDLEAGRVVARASRGYGLIEGLESGAAEQEPRTWTLAIEGCARDLALQLGAGWREVRALGVSGQQHGCVVLDRAGAVIRPAKLWCDTTTAAEARELSLQLGRAVPTGFTASKLLWLKRREPQVFARVERVLLPHDYVDFVLTGRATTEAGDASGTGYFDPVGRSFDLAALRAIDARLEGCLPTLLDAGALAGELCETGARLLGLPRGVPVATGGGDNMLSAIGAGATRPGVAVLSLGTSGTVFAHSARALVDPEGLIAPFCDSTGAWLPLLCVMNATGVLEEVALAFHSDHATLTREASLEPAGARGVVFLPYLQGERVPDLPLAGGSLHGLRPGLLRRGLIYRAALEGVAANLAWGVERMRALGLAIGDVRLVGGGAQNPLWRSILADALDSPITLLEERESAALGGAIQAAWCFANSRGERASCDELAQRVVRTSGEVARPDPARVAHAKELGRDFQALARRLHDAR